MKKIVKLHFNWNFGIYSNYGDSANRLVCKR